MKLLAVLLMNSLALASASAHGEHPSISELIVPAVNFVIVFGFIFLKAKAPLRKMFDNNVVKIRELVELAANRDREAQIKLDTYQKKLNSAEAESKQIIAGAEHDGAEFEKNYVLEVKQNIEKLSKDADSKVESEKNSMIKMLNETLLDEVISKAKGKISSDKNSNKTATDKLLQRL